MQSKKQQNKSQVRALVLKGDVMTTTQLKKFDHKYTFKPTKVYKVKSRTWDNVNTVTAKRSFLFTEHRFGSIPCYCFTSRITKNGPKTILSIPEYDLIEAVEV